MQTNGGVAHPSVSKTKTEEKVSRLVEERDTAVGYLQ